MCFFLPSDLYALYGPVCRPGSQIQVSGCWSEGFGHTEAQVEESAVPDAPMQSGYGNPGGLGD